MQRIKTSVMSMGSRIKNAAHRHRYHLAYVTLLAVISLLALRQVRISRNTKRQLNSVQGTLDLARKGMRSLTPSDMELLQGTLADEDISKKLREIAKDPGKIGTLTAMGLSRDLCKVEKGLCSAGIFERANMPQVNLKHPNFHSFISGQGGMHMSGTDRIVGAKSLRPLQKDLSIEKVVGIAGAMMNGKVDPLSAPTLVTEIAGQLYILNGHHRVAAARVANRNIAVRVIKGMEPVVRQSGVLRAVKRAPGVSFESLLSKKRK
jgi:hypothetical protein